MKREAYMSRVVVELEELRDNMAKLESFLLKHDKGEFPLMELQLMAMKQYAMILSLRIEEFKK